MSATPDENDEVTTTSGSPTMTNVVNQYGVDMDKVTGADKDAVCLIHITKNYHAATDYQNHASHAIFAVIEKMTGKYPAIKLDNTMSGPPTLPEFHPNFTCTCRAEGEGRLTPVPTRGLTR